MSAVAARISEIRALVHPAPPLATAVTPASTAAPASSTSSGASFAEALARAVGGPAVPPPTAVGSVGLGLAAAPASPPSGASVAQLQATYRNGRIPADALTPIGIGGHRLARPAAESLTALLAAAQRDGVSIGVTDSYRSYDAQVDVARRKGLYSQGGLAAEPGTSAHGWGLAVDLDLDAQAQAWMRAHGPRFGFVEDTPREPWHWAYSA